MRAAALLALVAVAASADPLADLEKRLSEAADRPAQAAALRDALGADWVGALEAGKVDELAALELTWAQRAGGIDPAASHVWKAAGRSFYPEGPPASMFPDEPAWDRTSSRPNARGFRLGSAHVRLRAADRVVLVVRRVDGPLSITLEPLRLTWTDEALTATFKQATERAAAPAAGEWHVLVARREKARVAIEIDGAPLLALDVEAPKFRSVTLETTAESWVGASAAEDSRPDPFPIGEWRGAYHYGDDPQTGTDFVARLHDQNGGVEGMILDGKRDPGTVDQRSDVSGTWNSATGVLAFRKKYRNDGHVIHYRGRLGVDGLKMTGGWSYEHSGSKDGIFDMTRESKAD